MERLRFIGQANCSGFEVTANMNTKTKRFATRDYAAEFRPRDPSEILNCWLIAATLCFSALVLYATIGLSLDIWALFIVGLSACAIGNILSGLPTLFRRDKQWAQWHACEHKLINIMIDKSELSRPERLKQASPYNIKCGSTVLIQSLAANLYFIYSLPFVTNPIFREIGLIGAGYIIVLLLLSFKYPEEKRTIYIIGAVLIFFVFLVFFSHNQEQIIYALLGSFAIQLLIKYSGLPYLAQRYLFTAEPTEEQYEETFLLALKVREWKKSTQDEENAPEKIVAP